RVLAPVHAVLVMERRITVVGEVSDARKLPRWIHRCRPDVVLMDVSMSQLDGTEVAVPALKKFSGLRIILLAADAERRHVQRAVRAGIAGYLIKDVASRLEAAIRAVAAGKTYFSPFVTQFLSEPPGRARPRDGSLERLTPRQ